MWWDGRMHELFGIKPGGFSGKYDDFVALVEFEDRPRLAREEITATLIERPEFEVEFRIVRPFDCAIRFLKMGAKVHFDAQGKPRCISGACWEVTEQRCTEAALIRELREELGIDVSAACLAPFAFASHAYERFHLLMPLYLCRRWKGTPKARENQTLAWVRPQKLADYPMPPADKPLIPLLRDFL